MADFTLEELQRFRSEKQLELARIRYSLRKLTADLEGLEHLIHEMVDSDD